LRSVAFVRTGNPTLKERLVVSVESDTDDRKPCGFVNTTRK
jgi:hypothetical protein